MYKRNQTSSTYGHRIKRTQVPVRSLIDKFDIGELVVGWVTTSESPLLYVFVSWSFVSWSVWLFSTLRFTRVISNFLLFLLLGESAYRGKDFDTVGGPRLCCCPNRLGIS